VQSTATSGFVALMVRPMSGLDDVTKIASDLPRIDVYRTHNPEPVARGDLSRDHRANRPQPDVHHTNHGGDYR
jgi:hypothetical protein